MRLIELVLVGIIALLLFVIVTPSDAYAMEKGLVWIGLGEAEGKYQEDEYNIEEEVTGSTFEYNEFQYTAYKNHGSVIKSCRKNSLMSASARRKERRLAKRNCRRGFTKFNP